MAANPPEITLELTGGSLTIRTAEAIYRILVAASAGAVPAAVPALPAAAPAAPALPQPALDDDWGEPAPAAASAPPAPGSPGEEEYYRELSHDMYREVGRLARRLSMSIRDVKVERMEAFDLENAGHRLEQAKDQLENVVKMTEQATMKIIDLGEDIQKAIDRARSIMERMSVQPPAAGGPEGAALEQANQELTQALDALAGYLGELDQEPLRPALGRAEALLELIQAAPDAAAEAPAPPAPPRPVRATSSPWTWSSRPPTSCAPTRR